MVVPGKQVTEDVFFVFFNIVFVQQKARCICLNGESKESQFGDCGRLVDGGIKQCFAV